MIIRVTTLNGSPAAFRSEDLRAISFLPEEDGGPTARITVTLAFTDDFEPYHLALSTDDNQYDYLLAVMDKEDELRRKRLTL